MRSTLLGFLIFLFLAAGVNGQTVVDSFPCPGRDTRGLAWDGKYLWCSDAETDSIYQIDPSTGRVILGFPFNVYDSYGGLAWSEDDRIWMANGRFVFKINTSTGEIEHAFSCWGG